VEEHARRSTSGRKTLTNTNEDTTVENHLGGGLVVKT